ncbi:MAG TPA: beta-N-acetylhexosaminidase [Rhizomicrobium sp.]|nr:beta-N-acetylhexosaminidase [Rhizomicrobium sp.]
MHRSRAIFGCGGPVLSADEQAFFRDSMPWGFILFARNIENPDQVRRLVRALRETVDDAAAPVLIDQEGGRVARLKPPHWHERPPASRFGALHDVNPESAREAVYLNARLIAHDLTELGLNVNCLPVLDVPVAGAHDVIGDRAFAHDPATVIDLGRAQMEGLMEGGVLAVMKHIPGHGRAGSDSHRELPRVKTPREELSATDFVPFRSLDLCPMAMTAHVVYDSIDPQRPATVSPKVIREVIRGEIGFDGLLMSDDLSMQALDGSLGTRAKAAQFAGCDVVLHCNGGMDEMRQVAAEAKTLNGQALRRAIHAMSQLAAERADASFEPKTAEAHLSQLLSEIP